MAKNVGIRWTKEQLEIDYKRYGTQSAVARIYGCSRSMVAAKMSEFGIPSHYDKSGAKNPKWRGGRRKDKDGYIQVYSPNHPYRNVRNEVSEHRLVMEKMLGRYLLPHEVIHHKNEVKDDNRPENLELFVDGRQHVYKRHRPFRDIHGRLHQTRDKCESADELIIKSRNKPTPKQLQVLKFLEQGYDRGMIAEKMRLVRKSVHNHITALRTKRLIP